MYQAAHHLPSLHPSLKQLLGCLFGFFTPELLQLLTRSGLAVYSCCFSRYRPFKWLYTLSEQLSAIFGSLKSELEHLLTRSGSALYHCRSSHHRHLQHSCALLERSFIILFTSVLPQLLDSLKRCTSTAYVFCLPHYRHLKASYAAYRRKNDPNCYFPLAKLPTEITLMIASYLDPISRVCYKKKSQHF